LESRNRILFLQLLLGLPAIYGPILCLLGTPFSQSNTRDKTDILKQGKPNPSLSCLSTDKKDGKVFSRSFCIAW